MINTSLTSETLKISVNSHSFDEEEAEQLRRELRRVNRPAVERMCIDFSEVETTNVSAIGSLLAASREFCSEDKSVILVQPQPAVRSLLEMLKLSNAFEIRNQ